MWVQAETSEVRQASMCSGFVKPWIMKGTKVLTLGTVGVYTSVFTRATYISCVTHAKFVGVHEYITYMRVHEKYACGKLTDTIIKNYTVLVPRPLPLIKIYVALSSAHFNL